MQTNWFPDAAYVTSISGLPVPPEQLVSYIYEPAVSPHLAAQLEKRPVDMKKDSIRFSSYSYTV